LVLKRVLLTRQREGNTRGKRATPSRGRKKTGRRSGPALGREVRNSSGGKTQSETHRSRKFLPLHPARYGSPQPGHRKEGSNMRRKWGRLCREKKGPLARKFFKIAKLSVMCGLKGKGGRMRAAPKKIVPRIMRKVRRRWGDDSFRNEGRRPDRGGEKNRHALPV